MEELVVLEEENVTSDKSFPLFRILYRSLLFIIIATIVCGAIGLGVGFLRAKPKYTAKCDVVLNLTIDASGYTPEQLIANNTTLAKNYLPTVMDVIRSPATVNLAKELRDNDISSSAIGLSYSEDSLIFEITYTDLSEDLAVGKLQDLIKAAQINVVTEKPVVVTDIKLVETQPTYSVVKSNDVGLYLLIGVVIGLVGSVALALIIYALDNNVKTADELEELTGAGVIAYIKKKK